MSALTDWDSFYVIVGSAAGALIGLQFVVMTLIAENPPARAAEAGPAFATPTIIHFSAVLLLSALLRMPWGTIASAAVLWGVMGVAGLVYTFFVTRRMYTQTAYAPVFEDWLFHALLPIGAYAALGISAFDAGAHLRDALFWAGGAALVLLFIGIHNAWDTIAYQVWVIRPKMKTEQGGAGPGAPTRSSKKTKPRR
ncbi:MAG: hypothetical protein ACM3ZT_03845 [Bacillota bacterium]